MQDIINAGFVLSVVIFSLRYISRKFNTKRQTFFFLIFFKGGFYLLITLFGSSVTIP